MSFEILQNSLQPLIQFLHVHPHYAGMITFFVVFCEALAVVGVIIPGTLTMTAIGILIGSGIIPALSTFLWAIFGAILGDYLSYLIGVLYQNRLRRMWPFSRWPKLLLNSEKFFHAHGGKSVMIGRFVGPMRAMIPTIAGMLKMPTKRFLLAAIPSASIWAVLYILPGVLLGALALELPPKIATEFLLWVMLLVIILSSIVWLMHHFFKRICRFFDHYVMKLWNFLKSKHKFNWLTDFLTDPNHPKAHGQLTLLIFLIITTILFLIVLQNVVVQGPLTMFNQSLHSLLLSIRTAIGDKIMLSITLIGDTKTIYVASGIFMLWLAYKRYWYTLFHVFAITMLCYFSVLGIKALVHVPRPDSISKARQYLSFPSGHVAVSISFYGFLAMMIARDLKASLRWLPYTLASIIVLAVIVSRLYLGVHWLTDVLGTIFLGLAILFSVTIFYRRRHLPKHFNSLATIGLISLIFFGTLFIHGIRVFESDLKAYQFGKYTLEVITFNTWKSQIREVIPIIPLYRNDRLGHPTQPFNLQWLSELSDIEKSLAKYGWRSYPVHMTIKETVRRLNISKNGERMPILPQLYKNQVEALLMTKSLGLRQPILILRLWKSDIKIDNLSQPFWLGTVNYYVKPKKHKLKTQKFVSGIAELKKDLSDFSWQEIVYPLKEQPSEIQNLMWQENILLIRSK